MKRDSELVGLTTVTLNRPDKLNAINARMHEELQSVCAQLQSDTQSRVVVFTGAGRAFSAGADLHASPPFDGAVDDPLAMRHLVGTGNRTSAAIEQLDQVTIAAVNGLTVGGAVAFLSSMDLRLAAASAWFSIPEIDLKIPLTWNALPRLMRELGPARTRQLVMTGDRFSTEDALRWGFLNQVTADDALLPTVRSLAAKLLAKDPLSLALTKSTTRALADMMVPGEGTHGDREYLMLAAILGAKKKS
ncbi:MAG TPA: enoyl-CoA hydratase/isomerase family protein [Candidatus Acidoferrales bacterium]|nr:enoyl-CoA hydratase/isomerase family protein [Candidatus Acidoferrales bacterium]